MVDTFRTARVIIGLVEFIGWLAAAFSIGLPFVGGFGRGDTTIVLAALAGAVGGLVLIAVAQIARAQIVTAENTGELVALIRAQGGAGQVSEGPSSGRGTTTAHVGGLVKKHKGRAIYREPDGFSVEGHRFSGIIAAERWIDEAVAGKSA